jgi:predicted nucleotidyltransferase
MYINSSGGIRSKFPQGSSEILSKISQYPLALCDTGDLHPLLRIAGGLLAAQPTEETFSFFDTASDFMREDFVRKYELKGVYLFGSYARGDATEGSDFDFRIVGGNLRSLYDLAALRLDLEDALSKPVDVVLTENMRESFYKAIKDDEVLLYETMLQ